MYCLEHHIPALDARIPHQHHQHQQHWSFVASVNKLTANPPCYKSCLSWFSALQTIKQTNIPVQPHCTVISCIVTVYSPKWILYTIWYRYWFIRALAVPWRSNSNDFIKKPEQIYNLYFYVQRLLYPGRMCSPFSVFKTNQKQHFPECNTIRAQPDTERAHTSFKPRGVTFHTSHWLTEIEWHLIWPIVASKKHRFVRHKRADTI